MVPKVEGIKKPGKEYATLKVYFGNKPSLLARMVKLVVQHPNISVSGLIVTMCEACIGTVEKAFETGQRKFKLNGKDVEY
jgi:hypothetical protein